MSQIRLGLIGDNIAASRAPDLHRCCGELLGLDVRYDRFIPAELGLGFDAVFDKVRADGLRGVNVTLPYKEKVVSRITINDPMTARIGAVNTVRFHGGGAEGFNTDYSGFIAGYRASFGESDPGRVVLIGAGGVGKAVAFGLVALNAGEIVVADTDTVKAEALVRAVAEAGGGRTRARIGDLSALSSADGVVNCTPLGMHGYPGSPVPDGAFPAKGWAFDAVYTPRDTVFLAQAAAAGAALMSGYELFFYQGILAFEIFTGVKVEDLQALRGLLDAQEQGAGA